MKEKGNIYHCVMIFSRKKDNPEQQKSTMMKYQELIPRHKIAENIPKFELLAKLYNARIYVSVNPVDMRKAREDLILRLIKSSFDDKGHSDVSNFIRQVFSSCMRCSERKNKKFLLDVDTVNFPDIDVLQQTLRINKIEWKSYRTKNGYHYIIPACDVRLFENMSFVEVKKDGMTVIDYIKDLEGVEK